MTSIEKLKNDHRYINAYMRLKYCPNAHMIEFDKNFILEDEGWLIPSEMNDPQLLKRLKSLNLKNYKFAGIPFTQYEVLKKHMTSDWEELCHLYVYEGDPFQEQNSYDIRPLSMEDAKLVYDNYSYKEHDGIDYIETIIQKMPTRGIWIDENLVSWVVQRDDGSIGIMYTLPKYRKMGLAYHLTQSIVNEILSRGDIPYLHIAYDNTASCQLAEKNNFQRSSTVMWFEGRFKDENK